MANLEVSAWGDNEDILKGWHYCEVIRKKKFKNVLVTWLTSKGKKDVTLLGWFVILWSKRQMDLMSKHWNISTLLPSTHKKGKWLLSTYSMQGRHCGRLMPLRDCHSPALPSEIRDTGFAELQIQARWQSVKGFSLVFILGISWLDLGQVP